jgi:hypothetical protein
VTDERILERAKSVTESYDDFIQSSQQYGVSDTWLHNLEGVTYAKESLMTLNENSIEQSQTLTFLKVFASTLVLLVVSPLANLSLWKDPLRSSLLSQETKTNT